MLKIHLHSEVPFCANFLYITPLTKYLHAEIAAIYGVVPLGDRLTNT